MNRFRRLAMLAASFGLAVTVPALAHTALVSSTPAAAATASNVRTVTLRFNEAFMPQLSGLDIVMTGMPGMAGHHRSEERRVGKECRSRWSPYH